MQDSADEDAVAVHSIKDDMPSVLDAAVSWPNSVTGAADLRGFDKSIEAGLQAVKIAISLLLAPDIHGVFGDID